MLCPNCRTENEYGASFCMECGTHLPETQTATKSKNMAIWKALTVAGFMLALFFLVLFLDQNGKYRAAVARYERNAREYSDLQAKYDQLEERYELYDLEGRYAVEITAVYNSNDDFEKIDDTLNADTIDNICVNYSVYDFTDNWKDPLYVDVIEPNGSVFDPSTEFSNHTFHPKVDHDSTSRKFRWRPGGESGIYKIIFYQRELVIAVFEIVVD